MVFPDQVALVPFGNPFALSVPSLLIPVAPVVVWVMDVKAVFIHNEGVLDATLAELAEGALKEDEVAVQKASSEKDTETVPVPEPLTPEIV